MATSSMSTAASPRASDRIAVVVMGVSGAGKTTSGQGARRRLRRRRRSAHRRGPGQMRSGDALTDDDRRAWLDRIGARLCRRARCRATDHCSLLRLKTVCRDRLRPPAGPALTFVYLAADPESMRRRVGARKDHYMPTSLVDSQFAALEPPQNEPGVIEVSAGAARRHDTVAGRAPRPAGTERNPDMADTPPVSVAIVGVGVMGGASRRGCSKPPRPSPCSTATRRRRARCR